MERYDLIVIGGGPGGYLAAERAGDAGLKVLLVEKNKIGGVCLNEGCIPTKTLLHSSKIFSYIKTSEKYGVDVKDISFSHQRVINRKNKVVKTLVSGVNAKLRKSKVVTAFGTGEIIGHEKDYFAIKVEDKKFYSEKLIISTGSKVNIPNIEGIYESIESGVSLTSKEALDIIEPPKSFAILGGGVIGLEMAAYYSAVGSNVTVFEMLDHIAGDTDTEISDILHKNMKESGIKFELSTKVTQINQNEITFEQNGEKKIDKFDKILISTGRKPNYDELGLDNIDVITNQGCIEIDEMMMTNIEGVYAVGDVNGKSMLAHTAYREAEVAVNHILGKQDYMRYKAIPSVIYTNPEVACIGETEQSAEAKGLNVSVLKLPMNYSGRYLAEVDRGNGMCKIIVDEDNNRILGVHLIGSYASEIIYGAALMIETELRIDDIKELVFPHPTVGEIIRETIFEI